MEAKKFGMNAVVQLFCSRIGRVSGPVEQELSNQILEHHRRLSERDDVPLSEVFIGAPRFDTHILLTQQAAGQNLE